MKRSLERGLALSLMAEARDVASALRVARSRLQRNRIVLPATMLADIDRAQRLILAMSEELVRREGEARKVCERGAAPIEEWPPLDIVDLPRHRVSRLPADELAAHA